MAANKIKKILIIRLSALGDAIHTLPMANAIRKQYPDAQIDWIVEDKAAEFIINNPLLNNVYVLEFYCHKEILLFFSYKSSKYCIKIAF